MDASIIPRLAEPAYFLSRNSSTARPSGRERIDMSRRLALILILASLCSSVAIAMPAPEDEHEYDERFTALATRPYTNNAARAAQAEIIALQVDRRFDPAEQAKIMNAIREWNYVLNGYIRFEVDKTAFGAAGPQTPVAANQVPGWVIAHVPGGGRGHGDRGNVLGFTQRLPTGGGLVLLYNDDLGRADLGNIVMHELGHVLGLEHDAKSRLMSVRYSGDHESCVDLVTVQTLAAYKNLPLDELNWCALPSVSSEN